MILNLMECNKIKDSFEITEKDLLTLKIIRNQIIFGWRVDIVVDNGTRLLTVQSPTLKDNELLIAITRMEEAL